MLPSSSSFTVCAMLAASAFDSNSTVNETTTCWEWWKYWQTVGLYLNEYLFLFLIFLRVVCLHRIHSVIHSYVKGESNGIDGCSRQSFGFPLILFILHYIIFFVIAAFYFRILNDLVWILISDILFMYLEPFETLVSKKLYFRSMKFEWEVRSEVWMNIIIWTLWGVNGQSKSQVLFRSLQVRITTNDNFWKYWGKVTYLTKDSGQLLIL